MYSNLRAVVELFQEEIEDQNHEHVPADHSSEGGGLDKSEAAQREDSEDSEAEDFGTYQDESSATTALKNSDGIIDRLYRLAFKIRNPATRSGFTKAQNYREIDKETGVDLIDVLAAFDLQHVEQVFLGSQQHLSSDDVKEHFLVKRLAKANTRRRQQFRHWKVHRIRVEAHSVTKGRDFNPVKALLKATDTKESPLLEVKPALGQPAPSMPSTATRVDSSNINLDETTSILSSSTYARLSADTNAEVVIPQLPKHIRREREFECPYCHMLCSGRTGRTQSWK